MVYSLKKKEIFIPIEIEDRELDSQLLLSFFATLRGYRIYLGSKEAINTYTLSKQTKSGIYLYKGCYKLNLLKRIKEKISSFVILDQELSPGVSDYKKFIKHRIPEGAINYINQIFVINARAKKAIFDSYPGLKNKIKITGWPRIDLLKKKNRLFFEKKIHALKNKFGNFFIFASDFAILSDDCLTKRLNQLKHNKATTKEVLIERELFWKKALSAYNETIPILKKFARDASSTLVIRPHPSENIKIWKKDFAGCRNIKVIRDGDIVPWILSSDAWLHSGSTTSLQSNIIGKKTFCLKNSHINKNSLSYKVSREITSYHDTMTKMDKGIKNLEKELNNEFSYNLDACNEILNSLDQLRTKKEKLPNLYQITKLKLLILKKIIFDFILILLIFYSQETSKAVG